MSLDRWSVRSPLSTRSWAGAFTNGLEHRLSKGMTMAFCRTFGFAAVYSRYLRSAFVAKPGIMNTMEMAKPTISTVLSGKLLAMVLIAMLTTVEPT